LEIIPAASIQIGDRINVRPGGRISVDGKVLEGRASVDESSLTGEPLPILRQVGDSVSSGTIALDGRLVVRVVACGSASALGRIAQLVYEAQITQAPIQRYADRVCRIFVPAVLVIALATFFVWWSMATLNVAVITAVTVLVISCPCALGIATPLAVMVGTGEASRRGILVRRATALQTSAQVRTVIFDKTGTITTGRPTLDQVDVIDNRWSQDQLLGWAAAAEMQSEHPLARAVVIEAQVRKIDIPSAENFIAEPGVGVRSTVEGKVIAVVRDEIASARIEVDGTIAARLTLTDRARPESAAAIAALRSMGCAVGMLTGDRKASALVVASAAGLRSDEVMADQTPESKSAAIAVRGASTVMMIGDGINDAGALSAAGIGVAMGSGTALAAASADAILLRDDPRGVAELIGVARETIGVVRQNLFLAFIYNAAAIPLAALGFLGANGPIIAAVAMGLSDISVVANTLRLRAKLSGQRKRLASGTPSV
jgi:Cu+-exporting ATPase